MLSAYLDFLKLAQGPQAHIEDRVGLDFRQIESPHQFAFRFVLIADDADDFVEIEVGNQISIEHLKTMFDFVQTEARPTLQHNPAMIQPLTQHIPKAQDLWNTDIIQHIHVE